MSELPISRAKGQRMSVRLLKRRPQVVVGLAAAVVSAVFGQPLTASAAAPNRPVATAAVPVPVSNKAAQKVGPYDSAQTIRLAIGLRPPNMAAEQQFLTELQDKSSPVFHQY